MNANANTDNFREQMIEIMAEHGLTLTADAELSNMTGQELDDAKDNNRGMLQMYDELAKLHERMTASAVSLAQASVAAPATVAPVATAKPKRSRAPKKTVAAAVETTDATTDESDAEIKAPKKKSGGAKKIIEDDDATQTEQPVAPKKRASKKAAAATSDEEQEPPKPKKKRESKKADAAEDAAPKAPRQAQPFSIFSGRVTTANHGNVEGLDKINVKLTFSKASAVVTEIEAMNLDSFADFKAAKKDSEMKFTELLEQSQTLLQEAFKKVPDFKLAGFMWAVLGGVNPFSV
jgi:hypothetical protein